MPFAASHGGGVLEVRRRCATTVACRGVPALRARRTRPRPRAARPSGASSGAHLDRGARRRSAPTRAQRRAVGRCSRSVRASSRTSGHRAAPGAMTVGAVQEREGVGAEADPGLLERPRRESGAQHVEQRLGGAARAGPPMRRRGRRPAAAARGRARWRSGRRRARGTAVAGTIAAPWPSTARVASRRTPSTSASARAERRRRRRHDRAPGAAPSRAAAAAGDGRRARRGGSSSAGRGGGRRRRGAGDPRRTAVRW